MGRLTTRTMARPGRAVKPCVFSSRSRAKRARWRMPLGASFIRSLRWGVSEILRDAQPAPCGARLAPTAGESAIAGDLESTAVMRRQRKCFVLWIAHA